MSSCFITVIVTQLITHHSNDGITSRLAVGDLQLTLVGVGVAVGATDGVVNGTTHSGTLLTLAGVSLSEEKIKDDSLKQKI